LPHLETQGTNKLQELLMTTFLAWAREAQATARTSCNSRADHIRNICSNMCASNSMGKGKRMDASKSIDISNNRATINSKDACNRKPTTDVENITLTV
jgi:hypothetical protein